MSQKKKKARSAVGIPSPDAPAPEVPGSEMMRRCLLGLVTALVVARPLVLGEDPGLLSRLSDTSGLTLTLLWLLAAVGWVGWRSWSGRGEWFGGVVEAGLLATVLMTFVSALTAADYRHPAVLIGWEWLALFLALFLVRQLARTESDQRCLLAAFLASAVSVAAYGVYQYHVELPMMRQRQQVLRHASQAGALLAASAAGPLQAVVPLHSVTRQEAGGPGSADTLTEGVARRLEEQQHAFATFVHPNSFAGHLALALPSLAAAAYLCWRRGRGGARAWLVTASLAGAAYALWVTHSRGALLGLAAAALLGAAVYGRRWLLRHKAIAAAGLAALALAAFLALRGGLATSGLGKDAGTALNRLDYWSATWRMIQDAPWLGVGPGNFGRAYKGYIEPTAYEDITDPHNFPLEVWATAGLLAALGLVVSLGAFFYLVVKKGSAAAQEAEASEPPLPPSPPPRGRGDGGEGVERETASGAHQGTNTSDEGPPPATRWEFYLGGMAGLLVGFALKQLSRSPDQVLQLGHPFRSGDEILIEGLTAGVRSVLWFALFALLEGVPWLARVRGLALATGVVALLVNLCVSGGIAFPSVAQPMWIVVGLALCASGLPARTRGARHWLGRVLPVPLVGGVVLAYLFHVYLPVVSAYSLARDGLGAARIFRAGGTEDGRRINHPAPFLREEVIGPLERAAETDPTNARWHVHLAHWYSVLWQLHRYDLPARKAAIRGQAIAAARKGQQLDPAGQEGYYREYHLRLSFASNAPTLQDRKRHYEEAAEALRRLAAHDPMEPSLWYLIAGALFEAGMDAKAREAARKSLELDKQLQRPERRLSDAEREQLRGWLQRAPEN